MIAVFAVFLGIVAWILLACAAGKWTGHPAWAKDEDSQRDLR